MKSFLLCGICAIVSLRHTAAATQQKPLDLTEHSSVVDTEQTKARKLHGRFLHITDIHPDPFYKVYSSTEESSACHRDEGPAGYYGAETTDCDTPQSLVNATFKWIAENLKDKIDFVVWTGDSARHDQDENFPRSDEQVLNSNKMLVRKMREVFGRSKKDSPRLGAFEIPIIPTFGNNDILPHNIFLKGPNKWTKHYLEVWRDFIPEEQRHGFDRGGWFYVEVIPNKLAVFSLNTMYFFDSNVAVDGCAARREPGYQHMEWLRIQLSFLRERGMKAILTGHVPPARTNEKATWDETCWQKYTLWMQQYRDVVVGSLYGHMNVEHFLMQDFHDIDLDIVAGYKRNENRGMGKSKDRKTADENINITLNAFDYLISLREQWADLPTLPANLQSGTSKHSKDIDREKDRLAEEQRYIRKIGGEFAQRFSVSQVSASIVPNYFPSLRVYEYNISGLENSRLSESWTSIPAPETDEFLKNAALDMDDLSEVSELRKRNFFPVKPFTIPKGPSKSAPPGPAYSAQTLSFTGYKVYYSNLTYINNDFPSNLTAFDFPSKRRRENRNDHGEHGAASTAATNPVDGLRWRNGKHHAKQPHQRQPNPLNFTYEVEYDTSKKNDIYKMRGGLTVRDWLELAATIGEWTSDLVIEHPNEEEVQSMNDDEGYESGPEPESDSYSDSDDDSDDDLGKSHGSVDDKKKKKKKKHKENKGLSKERRREIEKTWFAFTSRGLVGTMDADELKQKFG